MEGYYYFFENEGSVKLGEVHHKSFPKPLDNYSWVHWQVFLKYFEEYHFQMNVCETKSNQAPSVGGRQGGVKEFVPLLMTGLERHIECSLHTALYRFKG